jgi:hypothetical protein
LYEKGWWTTGVLGPIGSAVAAGRLLGLDAGAMASALGLAVAGTGGAKSSFGTDGKPLLAGRAAEAGVACALLKATDPQPWNSIIKTARSKKCDLVVMASHGRTGVRRWFLGSVAEEVLRQSTVPIMLIRQHDPESTSGK